MNKEIAVNAKRLSPEAQYQIRKQIVRLYEKGKKDSEITEILSVSERHVFGTKKSYQKHGLAGIAPKRRGRKTGEQRTLTREQEKEIQGIIIDANPEQMKLKCCLWTRKAIRELRQHRTIQPA